MRISVTYDDSDVAKALEKVIKDPNSQEFVKLLTPMICSNSSAVDYFFKLMLGNKLPDVIPDGTLCKVKVERLGYGSNKEGIRERFADNEDKVIVTVTQFRGYHEYSQYQVSYKNVLDNGTTKDDATYLSTNELEIIEEF